jgi:hypothetical protein
MLDRTSLLDSLLNPKKSKRDKKKQQFDVQVLALEMQTLSLMLNGLRSRVERIEQKLQVGEITQADRALLSNLDHLLERSRAATWVGPGGAPGAAPSAPRARTPLSDVAKAAKTIDR